MRAVDAVVAKPSETSSHSARVTTWTVERKLAAKVQENLDRITRSEDVRNVAIMPDVHLEKLINNGSVVATSHLIYPQAVGSDIGCGLSALRFQSTPEFLQANRHDY